MEHLMEFPPKPLSSRRKDFVNLVKRTKKIGPDSDDIGGQHWLGGLLGPITVATKFKRIQFVK